MITMTSRRNQKNSHRLNPLRNSMNVQIGSFAENLTSLRSPQQTTTKLSIPVRQRNKKYDPVKHYFPVENLSSMLKKLKEVPEHMRDYKNSLETRMFKKKLGLEKSEDQQILYFQSKLSENIRRSKHRRESSFESDVNLQPEEVTSLPRAQILNLKTESEVPESMNLSMTEQNRPAKLMFKSLNHHRIASKYTLLRPLEHEAGTRK